MDRLLSEVGRFPKLLRRAGYGKDLITGVARIMKYAEAYEIYRGDIAYDQGTA